jgi:phosphatidylglycerol---prolipoprotein diacylglyceryl transferase
MRPILIEIPLFGGVPIYSYGVMLGLSLIAGWYVALWLAEKDGLPKERVGSLYIWTAVFAVIGSRVLYVITNIDNFQAPRGDLLDIVKVNKGGLVAYGGFLGGFFTSWIYCHKHRISLLAWADNAVVAIALGTSITRIGCLMFGCDFGAVTKLPWGIKFSRNIIGGAWQNTPALSKHIQDGLVPRDAVFSLPVHPTQLYESLVGLSLVGILLLTRKFWRKFSGQIFLMWVMGYGILRTMIELVRDDPERGGLHLGSGTGWPSYWSESQVIGVVTASLAAVAFVLLWRRANRNPDTARAWEHPWVPPEEDAAPGKPKSSAAFEEARAAKKRAAASLKKKKR